MAKGLNETKVDVAGLIRTIAVRGQDVGEDKSVYVDVAGGDHKKRLRDVGELVAKLGHHAYSQRVEGLTGLQACCVNDDREYRVSHNEHPVEYGTSNLP